MKPGDAKCLNAICGVFRSLAGQLTVFPSAGIAVNFLPAEIPSKSFAWRVGDQKLRHSNNRDFS